MHVEAGRCGLEPRTTIVATREPAAGVAGTTGACARDRYADRRQHCTLDREGERETGARIFVVHHPAADRGLCRTEALHREAG